jgi:hypothetical protein
LKDLAGDIERQILRVDDTPDKGEPAREQLLFKGVRDEDALHVQLDRLHLRRGVGRRSVSILVQASKEKGL